MSSKHLIWYINKAFQTIASEDVAKKTSVQISQLFPKCNFLGLCVGKSGHCSECFHQFSVCPCHYLIALDYKATIYFPCMCKKIFFMIFFFQVPTRSLSDGSFYRLRVKIHKEVFTRQNLGILFSTFWN